MKWYPIPEIKIDGQPFIRKVKISGKSIVIVGYENELYALGSVCPHAREDLSRGWCAEGKLVCSYHRFSYDLQTGKGSPGQNDYVDSYAIKIRERQVYVGIETFWDRARKVFK